MLEDAKKDLCLFRIDKAHKCLKSAEILYTSEDYSAAANRAYYSMFHAIRAIMALDGEDRKKHSGVVAYFQENYIKAGVFDKQHSYALKNAFLIRQESDYEDFYIVTKADADEQIENAKCFLEAVYAYIRLIIG